MSEFTTRSFFDVSLKPMPLKAVFLLGTLKKLPEVSHTEGLCQLLIAELKEQGVESEIIRLVDYALPPGTRTNMGEGDDWPSLLPRIQASDMLILATPVWWGIQSSLMQRAIERMDELNDEIVATGKSEFLNKVGGMVITGAEDGAQHIIGNLANFLTWNGLTLPPACSLSYLGSYEKGEDDSLESLHAKFRSGKYTAGMARTMARNLAHVARTLKEHPLPVQEANSQFLR